MASIITLGAISMVDAWSYVGGWQSIATAQPRAVGNMRFRADFKLPDHSNHEIDGI